MIHQQKMRPRSSWRSIVVWNRDDGDRDGIAPHRLRDESTLLATSSSGRWSTAGGGAPERAAFGCCEEMLYPFWVLVSDEPFGESRGVDDGLAAARAAAKFARRFTAPDDASGAGRSTTALIHAIGRYVRVQVEGEGPLSLAEVEVLEWEPTSMRYLLLDVRGGGGDGRVREAALAVFALAAFPLVLADT